MMPPTATAPPQKATMSETTPILPSSAEQPLSRHETAAWIIDETLRGFPIKKPEEIPRDRASRRNYLFFENAVRPRQLASTLLVLLSFLELPSHCSLAHRCVSPDGSNLFLSGIPYLDPLTAAVANAVLLAVLVYFAFYDAVYLPNASLHVRPRVHAALLGLLALDFFYVALFWGYPPFRFAPFLRALLPLFYWNALRECTSAIFAVVNPFMDVCTILALFTLVFGWLITLIFHDVPKADRYFGNLGVGLYSAFTSLTTADWPMQIMAVLDVSRASAFVFLAFILIGVFLLFNILLAVVYNAYTSHIENLVIKNLQDRQRSIGLAHDVLADQEGNVSFNDIFLMFNELRKNKRHLDIDDDQIRHIFTAMDDDADNNISRDEFLDIVDVLHLSFVVELENISPMEKVFPTFYATSFWQNTARFVRSNTCLYLIDFVMIANLVVVLVETTMDLRKQDTPGSVRIFALIECAFSLVYIVEMLLKVVSQGFDRYWREVGNRFDFMITPLLLFGAAYVLYPYSENDQAVVRYLVLLRCLRLLALLADVPRFRKIAHVFSVLIPASVPLFSFLFLSLYVFAAAGVELFGGLIYESNPALNPETNPLVDAYVSNDYWALNFNDMASGWHTLFSAVIVSYLTEIAEAIAATSRFGNATKWFFLLNFIVNSLIVSNCVVAFVVDLFVMVDEEDRDARLESLQERFGSKRVKVLYERSTADQVYATMFRERVAEAFTSGGSA